MQCCIQCICTTAWFRSYDSLQGCAVVLLYLQVVCSLIGSLGAILTGLLVANLALALFGLVAVESGSQHLGRAYAALLACSLLVDIIWFVLFALKIRHDAVGFWDFSVQIVFWMQVANSTLRFLSSFLWLQMYRLGAAADTSAMYYPVDFERRITTFGHPHERPLPQPFGSTPPPLDRPSPSHAVSVSEEILGGSIYNPSTFSSLLQYSEDPHIFSSDYFTSEVQKESAGYNGPNLSTGSQLADSLLEKDAQTLAS